MRKLFNIGDMVVYGSQGVCKIDAIQEKQIGKAVMNYYVLKPVFNENTSVFVPVENATLTSKMQDLLTRSQAKELIQNEVTQFESLTKQIGEMLDDAKKSTPLNISNIRILLLSTRNRENADFLENKYSDWHIFLEIIFCKNPKGSKKLLQK